MWKKTKERKKNLLFIFLLLHNNKKAVINQWKVRCRFVTHIHHRKWVYGTLLYFFNFDLVLKLFSDFFHFCSEEIQLNSIRFSDFSL